MRLFHFLAFKQIALPSAFALLLVAAAPLVTAQDLSDSNGEATIRVRVSDADRSAAKGVSGSFKHILVPRSGMGAPRIVGKQLVPRTRPMAEAATSAEMTSDFDGLTPALPSPGYYPADVIDTEDGPVVTEAVSHPVYVNTSATVLGNPHTLLRDLGESELIHVLDQYTGRREHHRYGVGKGLMMTYADSATYQDADIAAMVHAAAKATGKTGYHVIYHLFFAPGQDVCSANEAAGGPLTCYSPDNPSQFTFCAYHDSVDFPDIGHVLYTVLPYQAVAGCQTGPPSPNGLVVDSTIDSLSHELFETITDPDGNAWWNPNSSDLYGDEISDECDLSGVIYPVAKLNGRWYELEGAYSNKYHGCAFRP